MDLRMPSVRRKKIVAGCLRTLVDALRRSARLGDPIVKRDLHAKYGVREIWIVDPDARTVEVMTLEGGAWRWKGTFAKSGALRSPLFPDLALPVRGVFD